MKGWDFLDAHERPGLSIVPANPRQARSPSLLDPFFQPLQRKPRRGTPGPPNGYEPPQVSRGRVLSLAPHLEPASRVLAIVDGSEENREAAVAGADLLAATPGLSFTVLAPADVAQPTGSPTASAQPTSTNGSGALLQRAPDTSVLVETTRAIQDRGLKTRMRTVEGDLEQQAVEAAAAHDLVVLPPSMASQADEFPVPTLVAP